MVSDFSGGTQGFLLIIGSAHLLATRELGLLVQPFGNHFGTTARDVCTASFGSQAVETSAGGVHSFACTGAETDDKSAGLVPLFMQDGGTRVERL